MRQKTFSQRSKEEAHDYRYFPEPDIPPIHFTKEEIDNLRKLLPELPDEKISRFEAEYGIPHYDAEILTRERTLADYFEEAARQNEKRKTKNEKYLETKIIANWIINKKIDVSKILPEELLKQITSAKTTVTVDDDELKKVIGEVLSENQKAVEDYKAGKQNSVMFLLGQVMRKLGKKVDANIVRGEIEKLLV